MKKHFYFNCMYYPLEYTMVCVEKKSFPEFGEALGKRDFSAFRALL